MIKTASQEINRAIICDVIIKIQSKSLKSLVIRRIDICNRSVKQIEVLDYMRPIMCV
jgi:hypothetical protein